MTITAEKLADIRRQFEENPPRKDDANRELTAFEVVNELFDVIEGYRLAGIGTESIAEKLRKNGVTVTESTLKVYLSRLRKLRNKPQVKRGRKPKLRVTGNPAIFERVGDSNYSDNSNENAHVSAIRNESPNADENPNAESDLNDYADASGATSAQDFDAEVNEGANTRKNRVENEPETASASPGEAPPEPDPQPEPEPKAQPKSKRKRGSSSRFELNEGVTLDDI